MKRIGLVASKISKGNRVLYNFYVILISFLFSLFMFIVVGATVIFSLAIIKYVGIKLLGGEFENNWKAVLSICMVSLTVVVAIFNVFGILINIKPPKISE